MIVISSREFREHQKKYLDLVDKSEQVIVQRGKNKAYMLTPINSDSKITISNSFSKKIKKAEEEYKNGEAITMTMDEIDKLLNDEI